MVKEKQVVKEMMKLKNPEKAKVLAGFFKTGKGQYAEGDKFLGITVPEIRKMVKKHQKLELFETRELLQSEFHEVRLLGVLILVRKYELGKKKQQKEIFNLYLANLSRVNNWDLVDLSADKIVGAQLNGKSKRLLHDMAKSPNLWTRRVAMLATFHDIKRGNAKIALEIAEKLLFDQHDLIQKAVGWMLREVGKRCSIEEEEKFLDKYAATMPRTTLRYAIERFSQAKRIYYMQLKNSNLK